MPLRSAPGRGVEGPSWPSLRARRRLREGRAKKSSDRWRGLIRAEFGDILCPPKHIMHAAVVAVSQRLRFFSGSGRFITKKVLCSFTSGGRTKRIISRSSRRETSPHARRASRRMPRMGQQHGCPLWRAELSVVLQGGQLRAYPRDSQNREQPQTRRVCVCALLCARSGSIPPIPPTCFQRSARRSLNSGARRIRPLPPPKATRTSSR